MKTPLKLILAAAAFALAPAAAFRRPPRPLPRRPASAPAAQTPRDAISANSQAAPAQPEEMSPAETGERGAVQRQRAREQPRPNRAGRDGRPADRRIWASSRR